MLLSVAGEQLLGMLWALHNGICVSFSERMMERTREEALKATRELILNGKALAREAVCDICASPQLVTVLRRAA